MIYELIGLLYFYLLFRSIFLFSIRKKSRENIILGSGFYIFDLLLTLVALGYLFNVFYLTEVEKSVYILDKNILWVIFVVSLFCLGIGVGMYIALDYLKYNMSLIENSRTHAGKFLHDTFAKLWTHICISSMAFSVSLMEISTLNPDYKLNDTFVIWANITISFLLGLVFYISERKSPLIVKLIDRILAFLFFVTLSLFLYESQLNLNHAILTLTFLAFITAFFFSILFEESGLKFLKPYFKKNTTKTNLKILEVENDGLTPSTIPSTVLGIETKVKKISSLNIRGSKK